MWHIDGPMGNEVAKIAPFIVPYTRGQGLDLGCGPFKAFPHFVGVDSMKETWGNDPGTLRQPDMVMDATTLEMIAFGSQDFIFSSHFLEHVEDPKAALMNWWQTIKPGGHLVLYLPHADLYPKCGEEGANPDHKCDFRPGHIITMMREIAEETGQGWYLLENETRNWGDGLQEGSEYSFYQVFRKRSGKTCRETPWERPEKSCLVIRYGAYGDHLMASSVLPLLKAKGFHVTYNCEPRGQTILRHDPNIDAFLIQDTDQVPNQLLGPYWRRLAERYDEVYNLSESIEGALLAVPGRFNFIWPDGVRRKVMGTVNYLDRTHDLCDVERHPDPHFYETKEERDWARRQVNLARYGVKAPGKRKLARRGHPVIMWCLSGSSRHKTWPHLDSVIANLLLNTDCHIVLTGDEICKMLEAGWTEDPRVWCRSGEWDIRQTLAFAKTADIVIGPETGIMQAVSMDEDVAKVIYLSHSSHENLTRDWINTSVLLPDTKFAPCASCHRMHYTDEFCPKEETTHTAVCAFSISPKAMMEAIDHHLDRMKEAA